MHEMNSTPIESSYYIQAYVKVDDLKVVSFQSAQGVLRVQVAATYE
jgi:hypothetical protein